MGAPLIYQRSVAQDLYVWALHTAYQGYRVYDPDYALLNEPDIFEIVLRDPVIAHAVNLRLHGVAARRWRVLPASEREDDKKLAAIVEEGMGHIDGFTESRKNMALAVVRARTFQRIYGKRMPLELADLPEKQWWVPTELREVDRRRFRLVPQWAHGSETQKLRVNVEMWSVAGNRWELMPPDEQRRYVKVVYNDEEARLGYGRGLCEALYFYHWAKGIVMEQCLAGIERWAQGLVTVKIDGLRRANPSATNQAQANLWLDIIKKQRSRNGLVFDAKDEIEVHETQGTGHQLCMEMIRYLDDAMVALILGSVLPFGGQSGSGSLARARTEREVSESLLQYDRDKIDEDIKRDLIGLFIRLNQPILQELGLDRARTPRFETIQETHEDPEVNARVLSVLLSSGMDVRKDEAYEKVGYTPPKEGEEIVEGLMMGMGGGPGGEGQPTNPDGTFGTKAKPEKAAAKDDDKGRTREKEGADLAAELRAKLDALAARPASTVNLSVDHKAQENAAKAYLEQAGALRDLVVKLEAVLQKEIPAPVVQVQPAAPTAPEVVNIVRVPQAPAPVVKVFNKAPVVNMNNERGDAALEKLMALGEKLLEAFFNRKPVRRVMEIKFEGDTAKGVSKEDR